MAELIGAKEQERNEVLEANPRALRMVLHAQVNIKSESNFFMGFAENISEGGVFVSTLSPPAIGDEVELAVELDDSDAIPVKGIVRWHRTNELGDLSGCGVQFVSLSDDARRTLEMLLATLEREPLLHDID
jgi:uncharacterized protein (TIGR02266 family)